MKLRVWAAGAAALALMALSPAAFAAVTVTLVDSGQVVSAIDGLTVDGKTYDVTFAYAPSTTFQGNPTGALDAMNAIDAVLNTTTAAYVNVPGVGHVNTFTVQDNGFYGASGFSNYAAHNWKLLSTNFADESGAQFTLAPVPEPASWAMMLLGFLGLGAAMRAHRRADLKLDALRA